MQSSEIVEVPKGDGIRLNTWSSEVGKRRPITQMRWVTSDSNPLRVRRCSIVKNEELEPARRAYMRVWRSGNSASASNAREGWEDNTVVHAIAMRAGHCSN